VPGSGVSAVLRELDWGGGGGSGLVSRISVLYGDSGG
jgi:hypothetical protein